MIYYNNITKIISGIEVLKDLSFYIKEKDILAIIGEEDSGKSILLSIMAEIISPSNGQIKCEKEWYLNKKKKTKMIRFVPDSILYYNYMTANNYLNMVTKVFNMKCIEEQERLCSKFNIDTSEYLSNMTYNDNYCIALIQAIMTKPKILILDSPYRYLEGESYDILLDELRLQNKSGMTIIISAEDSKYVNNICKTYLYLNEGKIISKGRIGRKLNKWKMISLEGGNYEELLKNGAEIIFKNGNSVRLLYNKDSVKLLNILMDSECKDFHVEKLTLEEYIKLDFSRWKI